jgi:hypothetical protein
MSDVTDPNARFKAASLIEAVDARVLSAALQQDVMAIPGPSLGQGGFHDRPAMPLAAKRTMGHDIFEEGVAATAAQQIWRGNQHAGCRDPGVCIRDKDGNPFARQHFAPDTFGAVAWFRDRAHFRLAKEI